MDEEPELWEPLCEYLALHPKYYEVFRESTMQLFYGDGPLPREHRHFVALMAASRHDCAYLIEVHSAEFLRHGGDVHWLRGGLEAVPAKLRKLDELNRLLAHQPWLVNLHHLLALTRCSSPDNWSLSELMHGAIILSHVHSLASFVRGCGIISSQPPSPQAQLDAEEEETAAEITRPQPPAKPPPVRKASGLRDENGIPFDDGGPDPFAVNHVSEVEILMERMRRLKEPSSKCSGTPDPDEVRLQFDRLIASDHAAAAATRPRSNRSSRSGSASSSPRKELSRPLPLYTEQSNFQYVDFAKRENHTAYPTFKIHDYNWEDQGYSLVSQLYGEFSALIDHKFALAKSLTYYTMGKHEDVDTVPFRLAVWNYVQSLFGIRHDDYDYHEVNILLQRKLKELIKSVCCFPTNYHVCCFPSQHPPDSPREGVMKEFLHSERVSFLFVGETRIGVVK